MTAAAAKRAAKARSAPIYLTCEKLVRPSTGELVGAWVPYTAWDQRAMRDRKYHVGTVLRAEMKKPRNSKFNGLAHALGTLLKEHADGFEGIDAHAVLKRLQLEADVFCEMEMMDASPIISAVLAACEALVGRKARDILASALPAIKQVPVKRARSIAFDEMEEGEFGQLMTALCAHIRKEYLGVPNEAIEEILLTVESGA